MQLNVDVLVISDIKVNQSYISKFISDRFNIIILQRLNFGIAQTLQSLIIQSQFFL